VDGRAEAGGLKRPAPRLWGRGGATHREEVVRPQPDSSCGWGAHRTARVLQSQNEGVARVGTRIEGPAARCVKWCALRPASPRLTAPAVKTRRLRRGERRIGNPSGGRCPLVKFFREDPTPWLVMSLEEYDGGERGTATKGRDHDQGRGARRRRQIREECREGLTGFPQTKRGKPWISAVIAGLYGKRGRGTGHRPSWATW